MTRPRALNQLCQILKVRRIPKQAVYRAVRSQQAIDFAHCHPARRSRSGCRPKKGARGEQADNAEMSLRHVAQTVGLDYQRLRHLLEKQGVYKVLPPNGRPWSEREVRVLRDYGTAGRSLHTIAAKLARTSKAVSSKAAQLGLSWVARIPGNPRTSAARPSSVTTSWLRYSSLAAGTAVSRAEKASGSSHQGRSEFETLMQFLRPGDTLIVPHRPLATKPARPPERRAMLGVSAEFENNLRRERRMKAINAMKAYMLPPSILPDDPDD